MTNFMNLCIFIILLVVEVNMQLRIHLHIIDSQTLLLLGSSFYSIYMHMYIISIYNQFVLYFYYDYIKPADYIIKYM